MGVGQIGLGAALQASRWGKSRRYNVRTSQRSNLSTALSAGLRWISWLGAEVFADFFNVHVLLQSPEGEADYCAFGNIDFRSADEARDAGFFKELE
jgi:hypothetical protein